MTHVLSLGAINTLTSEYVYPRIANKKDKYHCPECEKELILVKGEIRVHHFRHKKDDNPCNHYSHPTESQVHKDAKKILKSLLENKISIQFVRSCVCCRKNQEFEIPEMGESSVIELEHRFEHNNGLKIADVGYLDEDEIVCIFEIYHTHKTRSEDRPEPWFEIDAVTLINLANENKNPIFEIPCIRNENCPECIDLQEIRRIEALERRLKALEEAKESKELKRMREEELCMRNYEKIEKSKKNYEIMKEKMREKEEIERKVREQKLKRRKERMKRREELMKGYKERMKEEDERNRMRNEELFKIINLREKMNAEYETKKQEHIQKIIEKEKKQKIRKEIRRLKLVESDKQRIQNYQQKVFGITV
jgi:hypothetical protein